MSRGRWGAVLRYHPAFHHVLREFASLCGQQCGITEAVIAPVAAVRGEPYLAAVTGRMPAYHRLVLRDPQKEMQYHLSGYGLYPEEAVVRFLGESVERYAAVMAAGVCSDRIVYASRAELEGQGTVLPLEYLNLLAPDQQRRLASLIHDFAPDAADAGDPLAWVRCPSLVRPGEEVWVPAQLFFLAFRPQAGHPHKTVVPSFSTGTAAHRTAIQALVNALIEAIQTDAFVIRWYARLPARRVVVDDPAVLEVLDRLGLGPDSAYEIIALDYGLPDLPLPVFGVFLRRKDTRIPHVTFGVQGGWDPRRALVRAVMEAQAVQSLGLFKALFDPVSYHIAVSDSAYTDLDTNVLFFASDQRSEEKDRLLAEAVAGEVALSEFPQGPRDPEDQLAGLVQAVARVSRYAVFLDITPPELHPRGWHVMRVLIPELVPMCLPGFPYEQHPRLRQFGGVCNPYPHPLP